MRHGRAHVTGAGRSRALKPGRAGIPCHAGTIPATNPTNTATPNASTNVHGDSEVETMLAVFGTAANTRNAIHPPSSPTKPPATPSAA